MLSNKLPSSNEASEEHILEGVTNDQEGPQNSLSDESRVSLTKLEIIDSRVNNGVPHLVLTDRERLFTVILNGLIGMCSSFSMPIYWPILPELAKDFPTSEAKINYTVTAYLVMQSLAPVFISSLSDVFGRRPIISVCITGVLRSMWHLHAQELTG